MRKIGAFLGCFIMVIVLVGCGQTEESPDSFEAYYQAVTDEEVVNKEGQTFIDSQILLTAADGSSKKQIEKLVKKQNGEIVGYISISNDYQISFPAGKSYEQLNEVVHKWEQEEIVEAASLRYVTRLEPASIDYTKDPWIDADNPNNASGSEWNELNPAGNNWWAEAIMMPSVWNMDLELEKVKVGIYDTMFDVENEDLDTVFAKVWNNPEDADGNCLVSTLYENALIDGNEQHENQSSSAIVDKMFYHGTHVAGLIAAEPQNGFGIAGVSNNAELYGFSFASTPSDTANISSWGDIFEMKYCIAEMLNSGVKVINCSVGHSFNGTSLVKAAEDGNADAQKLLKYYSNSYEEFFMQCLEAGYDFLIIKNAGNDNGCDAKYDEMGAIENEDVKKHIIIVGAAENHGLYYFVSDFSNIGERVDIYAPGTAVLSDFPTNITAFCSGTSMATPIVSGVASLVWGMNPDLSAEQVRDIIVESANMGDSVNDSRIVTREWLTPESIPIVNAYYAVLLAQNTVGTKMDNEVETGTVMGFVYENVVNGNEESSQEISNATVQITDKAGKEDSVSIKVTDMGDYCAFLAPGTYTITVTADGYKDNIQDVTIEAGEVYPVNFCMEERLAVRAIFEHQLTEDQANEYAVIKGVDDEGQEIWSITTDKFGRTDGQTVSEIGLNNGIFYYAEFGTIVALSVTDGTELWRNRDYGGEISASDFGDNGCVYLCGYHGPAFFAMDSEGNTLAKIDFFAQDVFGANKIEYLGDQVAVTLEFVPEELKPGIVVYVNLSDYSFYSPELESVDGGNTDSSEETEMGAEDENISQLTLEEICDIVAEHYNQENHTDDYVVFEAECMEMENGYLLTLRYQGANTANTLVGMIDVNTKTGEVVDEWGNVWKLEE